MTSKGFHAEQQSGERHKEAVSVQTGKKLHVDTMYGQAFEENPPPLLLSAVNFNEERTKAVHLSRPERRLE